MKKLNNTFPFYLLPVIFLLVCIPLFTFFPFFSERTNIASFSQLYANSQYVRGEATQQRIDDATLYTYAGFAYLQGEDPTTINFEHPPLGKYVLGLSYVLFGNALILNLVVYALFLLVFTSLLFLFTQNKVLLTGSVLFLGLLEVYFVNVAQGMLDILSAFFLFSLFRLLFSSMHPHKKYIISGILLGAIAATKYPIPSIVLPTVALLVWGVLEKRTASAVLSLPAALAVYLGSYAVYFMNHSLFDFIRFEWFRLKWWVVDRNIPPFLIFHTLFVGSFQDWRTLHQVSSAVWSPALPMLFLSHFVGMFFAKVDARLLFLFVYSLLQLVLFALGSASYDRYLIVLIPVWIICVAAGIENYRKNTQSNKEALHVLQKKLLTT